MNKGITWPLEGTGVERYGCIPQSAANNLGEIPQRMGAPNPFEEFFWGGNTLGLVPSSLPHIVGYASTLYAPTSPLPSYSGKQYGFLKQAQATLRAKKQPRAPPKNPRRSPANPLRHSPAGPPEPPQKLNSRPRTPSKSVPQRSPRALPRWGSFGGPFLDRSIF